MTDDHRPTADEVETFTKRYQALSPAGRRKVDALINQLTDEGKGWATALADRLDPPAGSDS